MKKILLLVMMCCIISVNAIDNYVNVATILTDYNPYVNSTTKTNDVFFIQTSIPSTCLFYVDNIVSFEDSNKIAYSWNHNLNVGQYEGSIYCYYDLNNTRYYELIEPFLFNITLEDLTQIGFSVSGSDFDIDDKEMYIVTPCIRNIVQFGKLTQNALQKLNDGHSYYFQKLNNGRAYFWLYEGNHEFCLINGQIQYDENNFTSKYNINTVDGVLNLGNFNVNSEITNSYEITTEIFEIYGKSDPKAWGQTWRTIIGGLVLLTIGSLIVFVGVNLNNSKIVVAGALLVASALGVSLISFAGVLL